MLQQKLRSLSAASSKLSVWGFSSSLKFGSRIRFQLYPMVDLLEFHVDSFFAKLKLNSSKTGPAHSMQSCTPIVGALTL